MHESIIHTKGICCEEVPGLVDRGECSGSGGFLTPSVPSWGMRAQQLGRPMHLVTEGLVLAGES